METGMSKEKKKTKRLITSIGILAILLLIPIFNSNDINNKADLNTYTEKWKPIIERLMGRDYHKDNTEQVCLDSYEGFSKTGLIPVIDIKMLHTATTIMGYITKEQYGNLVFFKDNIIDLSIESNYELLNKISKMP